MTEKVCGANWLMVGEAASMPDPLTGNGVTSGIRHARHAVDAIVAAGAGDALTCGAAPRLRPHVFRLGHAFNAHIERAVYRSGLRRGLGLQAATYVYTLFAFFMNALHARFDPRGGWAWPRSRVCSRVPARGSRAGCWSARVATVVAGPAKPATAGGGGLDGDAEASGTRSPRHARPAAGGGAGASPRA